MILAYGGLQGKAAWASEGYERRVQVEETDRQRVEK